MDEKAIQRALRDAGFDPGPIDGDIGPKTRAALRGWQAANGFAPSGELTAETLDALMPSLPTETAMKGFWLPAARMVRIIIHWTAGNHKPSENDRKHYHILLDSDANIIRGKPSIALNSLPRLKPGAAEHTRNCNTGSIGVTLCGMAGAKESPFDPGRAPITQAQWDRLPYVLATLADRYDIPVTRQTILSHAEVQPTLGIAQRQKWDIARLPFNLTVRGAIPIGDLFRAATARVLEGLPPE
jgi:peptidoglycan hydrolase-like protein with peptidoglycan-binding domain